jgi:alginate O-acetyltransferase complex protein AlgI
MGNIIIKKEYSNLWLMLASLTFYAWGEPYLVFLMIISIIVNYLVGIALAKTTDRAATRKVLLAAGILLDLGILGYYKYADFFIEIINNFAGREMIPLLDIALPIGISFFTFQEISYIVDVYRGDVQASTSLANVALYISFFPQLIAGPIVKYRDIDRQIKDRSGCWTDVSDGFKRFMYGLGKKVIIANNLGICVDRIFSFEVDTIDFRTAWIGALAYTFQIYYDFSGYSDMAIGLGRMFGFKLPENFNYPYLSKSVSEFWRRWHISLGQWFKEYVYIPLGGNRKGKTRTYINLMIVFFLTGLWHGADLSFIVWGLYHVFFLIIERAGLKKVLDKTKFFSLIYTFIFVMIGWVLFRADNLVIGIRYISHMILPFRHIDTSSISIWEYLDKKCIFAFMCAIVGAGYAKKVCPERLRRAWDGSVIEAAFCIIVFILCVAAIASDTYNPFIYFQF